MVLFTDPICAAYEEQHLTFNKHFISLICQPNNSYLWIGDQKYGELLFNDFNRASSDSIDYRNQYSLLEGYRRYRHIFKVIKENKQAKQIVFLSFDNSLFPLFCLWYWRTLSHRKITAVIHNNLQTLSRSGLKRSLFRGVDALCNLRYVVLTESMKGIADALLRASAVLFRHPFFNVDNRPITPSPRTFLAVGRQAAMLSNGPLLAQFLRACKQTATRHRITLLLAIPGSNKPPDMHRQDNVDISITRGFIPREQYLNYFSSTTFVIFPQSDDTDYRASGTLIDTMSSGRIFIAPAAGHFREFPECGFLYEEGEFEAAIERALSLNESEIEEIRLRILKRRNEYARLNQQVMIEQNLLF